MSGTAELEIEDPGLFASVQDAGRFGAERFGVSPSGAADPVSLEIANRLVGNPADAAAIEVTLTGARLRLAADSAVIALAGAEAALAIDGERREGWVGHRIRRGSRIEIGPATAGVRSYLAVAGGVLVPPILGSRSTHWRSGLGGLDGRPLRAGDRLPIAAEDPSPAAPLLRYRYDRRPYFGGPIAIVPGPQADHFQPEALGMLVDGRYRISPQSDRMAVLLDGPKLPFRGGFNIVSDGVVTGSIQVPGHGRPLVLAADRQTTGGYPKIATVTSPAIPRLAQRRPNERVGFVVTSPEEAEQAYIAWRAALRSIPEWLQPA